MLISVIFERPFLKFYYESVAHIQLSRLTRARRDAFLDRYCLQHQYDCVLLIAVIQIAVYSFAISATWRTFNPSHFPQILLHFYLQHHYSQRVLSRVAECILQWFIAGLMIHSKVNEIFARVNEREGE